MRKTIWLGVGMAVAAGSLAGAAPPQPRAGPLPSRSTPGQLWPVADSAAAPGALKAQGGEGGEAGTAALIDASSDADYAGGLAQLMALLSLADELVEADAGKAAAACLQHAIDDLYGKLTPGLAIRKQAPFEAELKAAIAAATGDKDGFADARTALEQRIKSAAPATAVGEHPPAALAVALLTRLLAAATIEYGEAVEGKAIKLLPEYQYAYALVRAAAAQLAGSRPDLAAKDAKALEAVAESLAQLRSSVADVTPEPAALIAPAEFAAIVSRIELKASRLAN